MRGSVCTLLIGIKVTMMIVGDSLKVPQILEVELSHDPTISLQYVHPEEISMLKKKSINIMTKCGRE